MKKSYLMAIFVSIAVSASAHQSNPSKLTADDFLQPQNGLSVSKGFLKGFAEGVNNQALDSKVKEKLVNYYTDLNRTFTVPYIAEATTLTGAELPIFYDGTNDRLALFQNGTTTYLAEMKSESAGERIGGRIIKACSSNACFPVKGWIIDPRDNIFGIKSDSIHYSEKAQAITQTTLSMMVVSKEKGAATVDSEMQRYFVKALKQLEPTVTLKANTPVKIFLLPEEYAQPKRDTFSFAAVNNNNDEHLHHCEPKKGKAHD